MVSTNTGGGQHSGNPGGSDANQFIATIRSNFGGYLIAAVAVIVCYSVVDSIYPQYSTPLALVTLFGIALYYYKGTQNP